jgi:hypothetical protein
MQPKQPGYEFLSNATATAPKSVARNDKMNILLVNTNRMKPAIAPIGLDYLADSLVAAGHEPRLLDLCWSEDIEGDIRACLRDYRPDLIGVTVRNTDDCYFSGGAFFLPEIKGVVDTLRAHSDAPIVMGGVGFSGAPEQVMEFCGADYGIAGEGEAGFVLLPYAIGPEPSYENVPNLLCRKDGRIVRNAPMNVDLADLPPRRRAFVDNARYFREGGQAGFETKRGCDMACIYCADPISHGRTIRLRPPKMVVDELKALLGQGIDHFHTCDCEFNIPLSHAKDVCRAIIDAGIGDRIKWYAYCSVIPFDDEAAELFRRAGCVGIDFGADSGNAAMLKRLGRHFVPDDLARTADLCHRYGIPFMYDLLVGGPGETRETVRETIELMRRIDADCVGVAMGVRVYDGTRMADWVRSQGDMASNPDLYRAKQDNPNFLKPVFYISPDMGEGIVAYLHELVGDDPRFFLPSNEEVRTNYNYNDNSVLVRAIRQGKRGAYWDILRGLNQQ